MSFAARWRDFINRREPGARWMLALLALAGVLEALHIAWLLFGHEYRDPVAGHYIVFALTLIVLATSCWWSLPATAAFPDAKWQVSPAARRWVGIMAAAVTVLAVWPRAESMKHGFTSGELDQLSSSYASVRSGLEIEPCYLLTDQMAAHFAVEVLQQHYHDGSRPGERTARALPWTAGVLTVGLLVMLGAALGSPRAGLAAGLVLAMHPLGVQWSAEVSDHALRLLTMGVILLCILQALHTNRWRWWLALSGAQGLYLPGSSSGIVELALLLLVVMMVVRTSPAPLRVQVSHGLRLLAARALAGGVQIIPLGLVLRPFGDEPALSDSWARLLSGVPFAVNPDFPIPGASLSGMAQATAWRWPLLMILLPLAVATGLYFMLRQDWRTRIAAGAFVTAGLLFAAGTSGSAVLLLPVVMVWSGAGLMRMVPSQPRLVYAPVFIAVCYVMATAPALQRTMSVPRQPLREVLAAARSRGAATVAAFGDAFHPLLRHAEGVRELKTSGELFSLVESASKEGQPLFVFHSLADRRPSAWQPLASELEFGGNFVLVGEYAALSPDDAIRLYHLQPREQIINLQVKPNKD
jgi:hypothetical protein